MSGTIWLIAGAVLLLLELSVPIFVFCWFSLGALVVAAAAALGLASLPAQLLLFTAVSAPLVLGSRTIFKKYLLRASPGARVRTNVDALPGGTGIVLADIDNVRGTGRVELHGMEWTARSLEDEPIKAGARVHVVEVQGVTLIVEPETE